MSTVQAAAVAKLQGAGYKQPSLYVPRRAIVGVAGPDKSGKTHWALTVSRVVPLVAYININIGTEGVIQKFMREVGPERFMVRELDSVNRLILKAATMTDAEKAKAYSAMWEEFIKAYQTALEACSAVKGAIILDTETEAWEIIRTARFGRLLQVPKHLYPPVNLEYQGLLNLAYDYEVSLVLIDSQKDEYKNDVKTGGKERAGFSRLPGMVQCMLETFKLGEDLPTEERFGTRIKTCRHDPGLEGMEFTGEMSSFPALLDWLHGPEGA